MRIFLTRCVVGIGLLAATCLRAEEPRTLFEDVPPLKDLTPKELDEPFQPRESLPEPRESGLYGSAEYLLMRPRQSGLDYALVDPRDDITPQGPFKSAQYSFTSGLRIGIGYRFHTSAWEVGVNYTHLNGGGNDSVTAVPGGLLYPQPNRPGLTDSALTGYATARLNYNLYDLEMGRLIDVDEYMQMRLFTGIRFASIRHSFTALYNGRLADQAFVQTHSNFEGAGPIFGVDMRWKIGSQFQIFSRVHGGLIYGRTASGQRETNNGGATLYADVSDDNRSVVPMVGFALGASYQYRGVTIRAGYEAVNWFGLMRRPAFVNDFSEGKIVPQQSDLSIDGFFIQIGFAF